MLNNDMLLGNRANYGWRKIYLTSGKELYNYAYHSVGYSLGNFTFGYTTYNFPDSFLSNNFLPDGNKILALYSYISYSPSGTDEYPLGNCEVFSKIYLASATTKPIYIKKGKSGNVFTFNKNFMADPKIKYIMHDYFTINGTSSPSASKLKAIFTTDDLNKDLDIYIGLTPPHKKQKKVNKKKAQKGLLINLSRSFCAFFL